MSKTKRPIKLARASAYYRLAAKSERAAYRATTTGMVSAHMRDAERYRRMADQLVVQHQADVQRRQQVEAATARIKELAAARIAEREAGKS